MAAIVERAEWVDGVRAVLLPSFPESKFHDFLLYQEQFGNDQKKSLETQVWQ
jgi:hypothetical protein